jgi:large subunit ribosomal protein L36
MKVRASIKKRSADCKIVRRKGRLYAVSYTHLTLPTN